MALPSLNATFAEAANLPRKQMLAKWLVSETGETVPSNILISGISSNESIFGINFNGIYTYSGIQNGKPRYEKNSTYVGEKDVVAWSGAEWLIGVLDLGFSALGSPEDVAYPWLVNTWYFDSEATMASIAEIPQTPISNYYDLPERYLWAKIAVAAGAPKTEADYISLPKNYAWSDIYNTVAGASGNHTDWTEKQALGHIAAAYRGDTGNPEVLATYIDWPWRYQVASIIEAL